MGYSVTSLSQVATDTWFCFFWRENALGPRQLCLVSPLPAGRDAGEVSHLWIPLNVLPA